MASDRATASMVDRYAGFDTLEFDWPADRVLRVTMGDGEGLSWLCQTNANQVEIVIFGAPRNRPEYL
jgi:hypothetical protein